MWTCRCAKTFAVVRQKFCSRTCDCAYMSHEKVLYAIENKRVARILANSEGNPPGKLLARGKSSTQSSDCDLPGFLLLPSNRIRARNCCLVPRKVLIIVTL